LVQKNLTASKSYELRAQPMAEKTVLNYITS